MQAFSRVYRSKKMPDEASRSADSVCTLHFHSGCSRLEGLGRATHPPGWQTSLPPTPPSTRGSTTVPRRQPTPAFGPDYPCCCLLLANDDATGKPLWGQFQSAEDRDGCFAVSYQVFTHFGKPLGSGQR